MFGEKKYAWLLLFVLWFFGFFGSIGRFVQSYYQNDISEFLNVGRGFLGLTWSVNILISALCAPIGGLLVDKYGYKKIMILTGIIGNVALLTVLFTNTATGYFIGFGILSGLGGMNASSIYVVVATWFKHHRAKALVIAQSAGSLGLAALTPILVYFAESLTWIKLYWILVVIGWGSILFIAFILSPRQIESEPAENSTDIKSKNSKSRIMENAKNWLPNFKSYCKNPIIVVVMISLFTCGFNMGTVERHLVAIQQAAHVHESVFVSSLSLLGLLELVGGVFFSFLIDRINRLLALSILFFVRIIAFSFLILHFNLSPILFSFLFGASYLGAIPGGILVASETLKSSTKSMGLQTGVLILIHHIGGVLSGYLGGVNYDIFQNYQLLIAIDITLTLISAIAYYGIYRSSRKQQKQTSIAVEA